MRRARWSFRRARRIPPKKPAAAHRARVERALARLRRLQALGRVDLLFGDESGFCLLPSIPYLWQPPGKTLGLPSQAHGKRCNVVGFWRERDGHLISHAQAGRLGAAEFIRVVQEKLLPGLERPAVLVLDNGSLHRAKLVQAHRAEWKARGLRLLFLPPYSPHLNRIETLWRLIKHRWLSPEAYANFDSLWREVTAILKDVGSKYHVTFS